MRFSIPLIICVILALGSTKTQAQRYVEEFGRAGFAGRNTVDIIDPVEGFFGGDFLCEDADSNELNYVNCNGGYRFSSTSGIQNFDAALEELIFLEAARRAHEFTQCQQGLFDGYARDPQVRQTLFQNSFMQFQQIHARTQALLAAKDAEARTIRDAEGSLYSAKSEPSPDFAVQLARLNAARDKFSEISSELDLLIARVPFGNRPEMKEALFNFAKRPGALTQANFNGVYAGAIETLRDQAQHSTNYFNGIYVQSGTNTLYRVNEDLKKTLVKTGQIENVVRMHGMDQELASRFMCRAHARYEAGPRNMALAEIPLYFVGAYGLSRLALRAGVGIIRATTAGARLAAAGAQTVQWAARGAMMGMEAWQWTRIVDDVRQTCMPDEFLAAMQTNSCTPESEMNGVYQESSIAQCITEATLSIAPVAFVGAVRIYPRVARAAEAVPTQIDEVIVTAPPATGLNARYFTAADRERVWGTMPEHTRHNSGSRLMSSDNAARLSVEQRIAIVEDITGVNPSRAQAIEILRAVDRSAQGVDPARMAAREATLRQALTALGKTDEEIQELLPQLYRSGAMGRVPENLLAPLIRGTDPRPDIFDRDDVLTAANVQHRLFLRNATVTEKMEIIPLLGNESAQEALQRYTREGYRGLRIEDGVLKQNIIQDPERLIPGLHALINGRLARSNLAGVLSTRSAVPREVTSTDVIRMTEDVVNANVNRLNRTPGDFRNLTPTTQSSYIDNLEAAWRTRYPDEAFPRQAFDDARTRLLAGEFQGARPTSTYFNSAEPIPSARLAMLNDFPSIKGTLDRTETTLRERLRQAAPYGQRELATETVPARLRPGINAAIDAGSNPDFIVTYMRRLQSETFLRMLNSGDEVLIQAARRGELDAGTMENLLRQRFQTRGISVVNIDKLMSPPEFNSMIGRGAVIDRVLANQEHGMFSHIVQQDMYYDIIASRSGLSYQELIDYMGTPQGNDTWRQMFDGDEFNAFRPEWINTELFRGNVPLSYIPPLRFPAVS